MLRRDTVPLQKQAAEQTSYPCPTAPSSSAAALS